MHKMNLCLIPLLALISSLHSWTMPLQISGSGFNDAPAVATSLNGTAVVAWMNGPYNATTIMASRYDSGSWSVPVQISSGSGNGALVRLTMDDLGNTVAVWRQFVSGSYEIVSATLAAASSVWTSPVVLSTGGFNDFPQVAMNGSGEAICIWVENYSENLFFATLSFGGSWSSSSTLTSGFNLGNISVGIGSSGDAIIVFEDFALRQIFSLFQTASVWSLPTLISFGGFSLFPQLSVSSTGKAIATWINEDFESTQASIFDGTSWSLPSTVSGFNTFQQAVSAFGSDGFLVWTNNLTEEIEAANYSGGIWSAPSTISWIPPCGEPVIATDGSGTAQIAFLDLGTASIFTTDYPNGGSPTFPPTQLFSSQNDGDPQIASSGTLSVLTFTQAISGGGVIMVSTN